MQHTTAGWLIVDNGYRPATTLEAAGIDGAMVKMAEAGRLMAATFDDLPSASKEPAQAKALGRSNGNGKGPALTDAALNAELDALAAAEEAPLF